MRCLRAVRTSHCREGGPCPPPPSVVHLCFCPSLTVIRERSRGVLQRFIPGVQPPTTTTRSFAGASRARERAGGPDAVLDHRPRTVEYRHPVWLDSRRAERAGCHVPSGGERCGGELAKMRAFGRGWRRRRLHGHSRTQAVPPRRHRLGGDLREEVLRRSRHYMRTRRIPRRRLPGPDVSLPALLRRGAMARRASGSGTSSARPFPRRIWAGRRDHRSRSAGSR